MGGKELKGIHDRPGDYKRMSWFGMPSGLLITPLLLSINKLSSERVKLVLERWSLSVKRSEKKKEEERT